MAGEAFINAEQPLHTLDTARVYRPEGSRAVAGPDHLTRYRTVDAMVVERRQIDCSKSTAFETLGHFFIAEQVLQGISFALGLDQFLFFIKSRRLGKHAIHRRNNFRICNRIF